MDCMQEMKIHYPGQDRAQVGDNPNWMEYWIIRIICRNNHFYKGNLYRTEQKEVFVRISIVKGVVLIIKTMISAQR